MKVKVYSKLFHCVNSAFANSFYSTLVVNLIDTIFQSGMDEPMAKHFAHLYIRDPLTLFSEKIHLNDEKDSDHFEVSLWD